MKKIEIEQLPKEVLEKAEIIGNIFDVIDYIESIVNDDFCGDIEYDLAFGRLTTDKEKEMAEKIRQIYMVSHAWNSKNSCYKVHGDWRKIVSNRGE